ncbi:MAG: PQQ-binding-like beta-propeller repeat protein [Thermoplasmata archaeon]|nr:PQQ-binding-like beta-propeller repeat protein [Thermoplasmata archaeon]
MRKAIVVLIIVMLVVVATVGIFLLQGPDVPERELAEQINVNGNTYEVGITPYFNGYEGIRTDGPLMHGLTYRIRPSLGSNPISDRLYSSAGTGSTNQPYGLYSYSPADGRKLWTFNTQSQICTKTTVNNFGNQTNPSEANLRLFFGCDDGALFVLRDGYIETIAFAPAGSNVWSYQLDGKAVEHIAIHDLRGNGFDNSDMFFAGTTNGTLYAFNGPISEYNPITGLYNNTQPTLAWANHISDWPLTSPTVSDDGKHVFVGSRNGLLYGFDAVTGIEIFEWGGPYRVSDNYWSTSPVAVGTPVKIYASTGDGLIHCIWGSNGTAVSGWTHLEDKLAVNGYQLKKPKAKIDGGNLTNICATPDDNFVMVGSDTGYVYSMSTLDISQSFVFDTRIHTQKTQVNVIPKYDGIFSQSVFIVARHLNNTDTDPSDDFSLLYQLASPANSTVTWRLAVDGVVLGSPAVLSMSRRWPADVLFSTVSYDQNGTASAGRLYSFDARAELIPIESNAIPGFDLLTISIATIAALAIMKIPRKKR